MNLKQLMVKLNQVSSLYLGKIMYALFLMSIMETLASFALLSPVMRLLSNGANPLVVKAETFLLAFFAICVWLSFQFGFAIMLLKMTRREYTNLGFLFIGFRRLNPAGKVIGAFGGLIAILSLVARFVTKFIFYKINPDFSFDKIDLSALQNADQIAGQPELLSSVAVDMLTLVGIFLGVLFVLGLFVLIRFVFVFQLHFDNPSMSLLQLFKKSNLMMRKNVFRLILFALRAGGKQLFIAVFLAVIVNFIPESKTSGLSVLVFIIDMIYFINMYTAMVRIYLTVPVMYEEILHPKLEIEA
ncbi:MAG: hypothetical protein IJJ71_09770 [Treponema sp.]|uniref:hypothetical protein n=1 Tax=Treponema sp. TaxID=166 RepID=UPI0025FB0420|nr:hypothetical protein [Treponema sp.]MBR0496448.1 hypothetical protein [Treponema sp.]